MKVAGHGTGELRFGVTHRSGQRTATSKATPGAAASSPTSRRPASPISATAHDHGRRSLDRGLDAQHGDHSAARPARRRAVTRAFKLEASKDEGISYECRFGDAAWAPCEGNPHRPGPLADGPYTLEVARRGRGRRRRDARQADVPRRHRRARARRSPARRAA